MFQYEFWKRENGRISGLYGICSGVCLDSKSKETLRFSVWGSGRGMEETEGKSNMIRFYFQKITVTVLYRMACKGPRDGVKSSSRTRQEVTVLEETMQ